MEMLQHLFEYVVSALFAIGAYLWTMLFRKVEKLEDKVDAILTDKFDHLRLEIKSDLRDLKGDIKDLSDKLDNKQDKQRG